MPERCFYETNMILFHKGLDFFCKNVIIKIVIINLEVRNMPNIRDVAKEAGVSISTVSRVIQGSSNVLPETRERIEEAMKKLDYHPNRLAQQFRTQQTKNILVIIPELGNAFYADILLGIESVAAKNNYSILVVDSHSNAQTEERCYDMLTQKQVDGIITFSIGIDKEKLKVMAAQHPIVIGCRYFSGGNIPNVTIDNIKAIKDVVSYMLNLGHKRICYLAGPSGIQLYRDRQIGYVEALKQRRIPVDPGLIVNCEASIQGGYDAVNGILSQPGLPFTAVVASGDTMAIGAIRALNDRKYKVPGDVAVAGFDDIELSSLFSPPLTTVRQPKQQIGIRSMEKLLDLIAGNPLASYRDVLNYELVIRDSSGSFVG